MKNAILAPYEQFEEIYKAHVTEVYQPADIKLREKINAVENNLKSQKRSEASAYFQEYAASMGIDFLKFEDTGITVTLSSSKKSLIEQSKAFVDKVVEELAMIETQEHAAEILVEYRKTLNSSRAIMEVMERHKAIDAEMQRKQQTSKSKANRIRVIQNVDDAIAAYIPTVETTSCLTLETSFRVWGTLEQLKTLKAFLMDGGYEYEQL